MKIKILLIAFMIMSLFSQAQECISVDHFSRDIEYSHHRDKLYALIESLDINLGIDLLK